MKKTQLKETIKQIVREAIQSREYNALLNEVAPSGKKSERMIKHVKKSLRKSHPDWTDDRIASVAIATAWKSKKSKKSSNVKEAGLTSENDGEDDGGNDETTLKNIASRVSSKGIKDPTKAKFLISQVFLHKTGHSADMDSIDQLLNSLKEDSNEEDSEDITLSTDNDAEIDTFSGNDNSGGEDDVDDINPQVQSDDDEDDDDFDDDDSFDSTEYETNYSENEEVKLIQAIKLIATKLSDMHKKVKPEVDEATYKVVSPNQTDSAKEQKARKIQTEPKVSENFKVQTGPSCRTSNDSKNDPKNVRDPKLG